MNDNELMKSMPIPQSVAKMAIPSIISSLVTVVYNMADTFFVGMLKSNAATGAVGVVFSLMAIIQAIGFFFGQGSGNFISREIGHKNYQEASEMASTGTRSRFSPFSWPSCSRRSSWAVPSGVRQFSSCTSCIHR